MTIPSPNPFQKPTTPKNGLELLKWVIFEPVVLKKFFENMGHTTISMSSQDNKDFFHSIVSELKKFLFFIRVILSFVVWSKLTFFLVVWSILGLMVSLEDILNLSIGSRWSTILISLTLIILIYLLYFRLLFYPYYFLKIFSNIDFYHNPYIHDGMIWLPLPTVRERFTRLAAQQPDVALEFVNFLLEYRPLQRNLAMHILHAMTAEQWARFPLDADKLLPPRAPLKTCQNSSLPTIGGTNLL